MTKKERFEKFIEYFENTQPIAETELNYKNNFELLVAVILSAQCTDKRVNLITPTLFDAYPDSFAMSKASADDILNLIKSCSYPNNKAKHLIGMAKKLVSDFNGEVPADIDKMQTIPGVGRKTANVMGAVAFDIPSMPVDTHVFRVSERIGLSTNSKTPLETEKQLVKYFPREKLNIAHHWILLHGRYVCVARKPKCEECGINEICRYYSNI